jgi:hypothetical protein
MGGSRGLGAIATLVLLSVAAVASCGSEADDPATGDRRTAAVYESILDWMLDEEPGISIDQNPEWVLFVGSRSEGQIDLDVQVAVVEALEPRIFVRFIDERSEAVDVDSENEPVRDRGLLVGLGAVAEQGESVEVYADRYRRAGDVEAWLVTVRRAETMWEIVGSPLPTDVRPLPADG